MIKRSDTFEQLNSSLEMNYRASLFDFSYLLAIALNKKFWLQPLSDLKKEEFEKGKKFLKHTYKKSPDFHFMENTREFLCNEIEKINRVLASLSKGAGRPLGERSKLVLLWTQILKKPKRRKKVIKRPLGKQVYWIKKVEIEREEIDWNDFYDLKRWFYARLKNCLYSKHLKVTIEPSPTIREKEKVYEKSLWEKNYSNYRQEVNNEIWIFKRIQEYFKGKEKKLPIKIGKNKWIPLERHPIILVSFKKDSIEIGELSKKGILLKNVRFMEKQKDMSEVLKTDMKIECPTVIFPNGDPLTITDYTPPSSLSTKLLNHYLEGAIAEILKKKNNTCE